MWGARSTSCRAQHTVGVGGGRAGPPALLLSLAGCVTLGWLLTFLSFIFPVCKMGSIRSSASSGQYGEKGGSTQSHGVPWDVGWCFPGPCDSARTQRPQLRTVQSQRPGGPDSLSPESAALTLPPFLCRSPGPAGSSLHHPPLPPPIHLPSRRRQAHSRTHTTQRLRSSVSQRHLYPPRTELLGNQGLWPVWLRGGFGDLESSMRTARLLRLEDSKGGWLSCSAPKGRLCKAVTVLNPKGRVANLPHTSRASTIDAQQGCSKSVPADGFSRCSGARSWANLASL